MLKKFTDVDGAASPFVPGVPVYVVMRDGSLLDGYSVASSLMELVALDRSPLDGTEKQGFTIKDDYLVPNWCEGKRKILAAYASFEKAEELARQVREKRLALGGASCRPQKQRKGCEY